MPIGDSDHSEEPSAAWTKEVTADSVKSFSKHFPLGLPYRRLP